VQGCFGRYQVAFPQETRSEVYVEPTKALFHNFAGCKVETDGLSLALFSLHESIGTGQCVAHGTVNVQKILRVDWRPSFLLHCRFQQVTRLGKALDSPF